MVATELLQRHALLLATAHDHYASMTPESDCHNNRRLLSNLIVELGIHLMYGRLSDNCKNDTLLYRASCGLLSYLITGLPSTRKSVLKKRMKEQAHIIVDKSSTKSTMSGSALEELSAITNTWMKKQAGKFKF